MGGEVLQTTEEHKNSPLLCWTYFYSRKRKTWGRKKVFKTINSFANCLLSAWYVQDTELGPNNALLVFTTVPVCLGRQLEGSMWWLNAKSQGGQGGGKVVFDVPI